MLKPAVFIDRDGTINKDCPYCSSPEEIYIYRDALEAIRKLSKTHYVIVVTNQSGIARGYLDESDLERINRKISEEVRRSGGRIDAFYHCPHMPDQGCNCRKPRTGMIEDAANDFAIDFRNSFVVGDSDSDMELGMNAGLRSIRVRKRGSFGSDFYAKDLNEAEEIIRRESSKATAPNVPEFGIILAGGRGTRMKPLTDRVPKPMAKVGGVPIIEHILRDMKAKGIRRIFISIGYRGEMIRRYFGMGKALGVDIDYVKEDHPLGTGGGLRLGLKAIHEKHGMRDVFVTNGDDLFDLDIRKMYAQHIRTDALVTLALKRSASMRDSGVVILEGVRAVRFVEKPDRPLRGGLVNLGKYIISTSALRIFPDADAFSFEREFLAADTENKRIFGYRSRGRWHQINTVDALRNARSQYG